jgi:protein-tyrosine phosphatase
VWSDGLVGLYELFLFAGGNRIGETLKKIAQAEKPVLFHCSWGKDRTGVISALVLLTLGVSEADVIEDFAYTEKMVTNDDLKHLVPKGFHVSTRNKAETDALLSEIVRAPAHVMKRTIENLKKKYGSIEKYLDTIGFDSSYRQLMREKYLANKD